MPKCFLSRQGIQQSSGIICPNIFCHHEFYLSSGVSENEQLLKKPLYSEEAGFWRHIKKKFRLGNKKLKEVSIQRLILNPKNIFKASEGLEWSSSSRTTKGSQQLRWGLPHTHSTGFSDRLQCICDNLKLVFKNIWKTALSIGLLRLSTHKEEKARS